MKKLLTVCRSLGIFVMIDETYIEFAPEGTSLSAVSLVPEFDNFMVIRGVSKFFAAPGLRFGYGLTSNQAFLQTLLTHQNPWSLNNIGAYAGERIHGTYDDNGEKQPANPGDLFLCKDGDAHGIKNTGDEELTFMALILKK